MNRSFLCFLPLFLLLTACAMGEKARETANWPYVQSTWPEVKEDVERGFTTAQPNETVPLAIVVKMDAATAQDSHVALRGVDWMSLLPWGVRGVEAATYSEGLKISRREQLRVFTINVNQIQRTPQ